MHKETTAFGPLLWLQVRVDKAPMMIYPPTITVPSLLATPPSQPEQSLTNENLLKSIGFIPSGDSTPLAGDHSQPAPPTSGCASEKEDDGEVLLTTFDVVETPRESVHSLSSCNSFNQTAPLEFEDSKQINIVAKFSSFSVHGFYVCFSEVITAFVVSLSLSPSVKLDDAASVASEDSDFVVVLPDCFDLDKPLSGFSSLRSSVCDPTASIKSHDSQVTSQQNTPSVKVETPSHVTPLVGGASPDTARKANFVPERITLKQVKESRLYNPITMATGLVNTVTDLVDKRVNFSPKKSTDDAPPTTHDSSTSDSDEDFEV